MTTALYPGSFDPVTNGHADIAARAASIFDRLIIAVYDTPSKNLLFTTAERMDLFRKTVEHIGNAEVISYTTGLTVELARKLGAQVMIRGLRQATDFQAEFDLALMNSKLAPEIETLCLMTANEHQFVSSSLLKDAVRMGGNIRGMVPTHVIKAMQERYDTQT
jgi:pantetheine-phosphate adenylyltransferase